VSFGPALLSDQVQGPLQDAITACVKENPRPPDPVRFPSASSRGWGCLHSAAHAAYAAAVPGTIRGQLLTWDVRVTRQQWRRSNELLRRPRVHLLRARTPIDPSRTQALYSRRREERT
jgi:hypothetical protein